MQELQDSTQKVMTMLDPADTCPSESEYREEMRRIRKDIVNLHGEMVLLENYSNVNYTGSYQHQFLPYSANLEWKVNRSQSKEH